MLSYHTSGGIFKEMTFVLRKYGIFIFSKDPIIVNTVVYDTNGKPKPPLRTTSIVTWHLPMLGGNFLTNSIFVVSQFVLPMLKLPTDPPNTKYSWIFFEYFIYLCNHQCILSEYSYIKKNINFGLRIFQ